MINKNITSKEDTISIASGYEIEDIQGNRAKVCYIDYVSRIVVIVQDGKGHNLFFHEICRDWFRVLDDTAENFNFIEYTKASISLLIGDIIVGSAGTACTVIYIDYKDLIVTISEQGNNYNITFDTASSGDYRKVLK